MNSVNATQGLASSDLFLDHQGVHDGKNAGSAEIVALDVERLLEEPPHHCTTPPKSRGRPGRDQRVDLSTLQHLRQRAVRGREAHGDSHRLGGLEWNATGLFEPALHPFNVGRAHSVVVCQDAARPHRGGHLVLGYTDPFATKVLRAADARALVDEDARLSEEARRKNRDRDEVVGAATAAHYIPAQRELRCVELAVLSHAPEDFLHAQHDVGQVDALCPDPTVAEGLRHDHSGPRPRSSAAYPPPGAGNSTLIVSRGEHTSSAARQVL